MPSEGAAVLCVPSRRRTHRGFLDAPSAVWSHREVDRQQHDRLGAELADLYLRLRVPDPPSHVTTYRDLLRAKRLHEEPHPWTKPVTVVGGPGRPRKTADTPTAVTKKGAKKEGQGRPCEHCGRTVYPFAHEAAKAIGVNARTIRRWLGIAGNLDEPLDPLIEGTDAARIDAELTYLSKQEPEVQVERRRQLRNLRDVDVMRRYRRTK